MKKIENLKELKGKRISLKKHPITFKHAEKIFEIVDRNREEFKIIGFPQYTLSAEDVFTGFLLKEVKEGAKSGKKFEYMIMLDDKYIGNIAIMDIRYDTQLGEIGYWLDKKYVGNGYITEAVQLLENYLFQIGFNRLQITCAEINIASKNVAERCGFKFEGRLRDYKKMDGKFYDRLIYSKLKSD